ncbi:peptide ABC transporter ATP-binding protein [Acuticoccus sediminis]|uniref:Peptide ABC transporter ATP-binding protein n=1 Tax=Acuticoccus sediminis TaxID=2184697 RepID=A0A8B2NW65_9HYPH|nr:ABC transporter ATP-binding protein [Acuticoccus sediminis]RAI02033.1 peptide ABC transporter ATP-binding protein [Acuticoccus sediminis]
MADPVLVVENLVTEIGGRPVVDRVSLSVMPGEVVAIVGESGSGKSLTALSVMGLLPAAAKATSGHVRLDGDDLLTRSEAQMRALRGVALSMIFQEPIASLNPLLPVGEQVAESLVVHGAASGREAARQAVEMLRRVGIPQPERRARQLPAELSGGMCQRVMIASALISNPRLLIADEPTTALDVTIQAQILRLMKTLREERGTAILLITHDMGVVADIADRVCVMYGGRIVETAPVEELFARPSHPYTRLLLSTIPRLTGARKEPLRTIEGTVPDVSQWPTGCRFRTRCPLADDACAEEPPLETVAAAHASACWHIDRMERSL